MAEHSQVNRESSPLAENRPTLKMSESDSPTEKQRGADGEREPITNIEPKMIPKGRMPLKQSMTAPKPDQSVLRKFNYQSFPSEVHKPTISKNVRKVQKVSERKELKNDVAQKSNIFPMVLLLIAIFLGVAAVYYQSRESPTTLVHFNLYEEELKKMQVKYTNQTDRFWTTFLSSLEPILDTDDPDLPAVIMMAVPEDHHSMGLCFTRHVAEVLNKLLGGMNPQSSSPSYVDGSKFSSLSADEQKVKLDEEIRKIIESKQRTVIVSGLEKIDPQAILLFHGYCDNLEAVFKDIAIIFIVQIPEESNFSTDREIYAFLFKLWTVLGPAKTKALLARMANNVAIMQKNSHFIC